MKFRVLDAETGEEIIRSPREVFKMNEDGSVAIHQGGHSWRRLTGYIVEFAFRKDEENQWVWEHSVIHE